MKTLPCPKLCLRVLINIDDALSLRNGQIAPDPRLKGGGAESRIGCVDQSGILVCKPKYSHRFQTSVMAYLHYQRWTQMWVPNLMVIMYYAGYVTLLRLSVTDSDPYFYIGQESEFMSVSESVSGNVNQP